MYKQIIIDQEHNRLLCSPNLVGKGEIVEIFSLDENTDRNTTGKLFIKTEEPNVFQPKSDDSVDPRQYHLGEKCILRVLYRNLSGTKRRKFSADEKTIVNMEHGTNFKEKKVVKAKTGSVRRKRRKK